MASRPSAVVRPTTPFVVEIERWADLAGLGLTQVAVTGHRFTTDHDIFDAIDLGHARTLLTFDSRAVQQRIEALPWVARASIERIVPDRLEVRITERAPFAVWRMGTRHVLIDKTGRELAAIPADAMPGLPRVAGEGAATHAASLFALLGTHPELLRQVAMAERIGGRRWTLRLAGGGTIHLPSEGEAEALARIAALAAAGLTQGEIDLRVSERTTLRDGHG